MEYIDQVTGAVTLYTGSIAPQLAAVVNFDDGFNADAIEYELQLTAYVGGVSRTMRLPVQDVWLNLLTGGPRVPNAALRGQEVYLTADATAGSAEDITVAPADVLNTAGVYLLMHRHPTPAETGLPLWTNTAIAPEIVTLSAATGGTATIETLVTSRKAGAVMQLVCGVPESYRLLPGLRYLLERPDPVTNVTAVKGTGATLNISWDAHPYERSSGGVVTHYGLLILRKEAPYAEMGPPRGLPARAQLAQVAAANCDYAITAITAADGRYTVNLVDRYWKQSDNSLAALTTGSYYALVLAKTGAGMDETVRLSEPACSPVVAITVS